MFRSNKTIIFFLFFIIVGFICACPVLAQVDTGIEYASSTGLGTEDPRIVVANIIRIALGFLGIIAVAIIMYGGWLWMTSEGSPDKVDKAKKVLISAIIGLLLILSAFAIANFVLKQALESTGGAGSSGGGGSIPGGGGGNGGLISCDGNVMTPACEADNNLCDDDEYCDASDCLCHPLGGVGDPCDADTSTAACDADNDLCMSYLKCDDTAGCICVGAPVIEWISPVDGADTPNGAPGNFITIAGRYFGTTTGQVLFWDGSDFTITAPFPDLVNSDCTNNWTDNLIIVVVPAGAVDGPIMVVRNDGENDTTDNDRGPLINDFDINSITRPGICLVNPDNGYFEDSFNIQGTAFAGDVQDVRFGNNTASTSAIGISSWTNTSVDAQIPNINSGFTTIFIHVDNEDSNYLPFEVLFDYNNQPIISYIDPEQGPPGQYITIYGSNFKTYFSGTSQVEFEDQLSGATFSADGFDFPEECRDRWWHDTYITVKVPPAISSFGDYNVRVTNRLGNTSDPFVFPVTNDTPGPGICLLDPHNGPVGKLIDIYGDNLGNSQGASVIQFYNTINATNYSDWSNQNVEVNVPAGAETGPVAAVVNGNLSNHLLFTVGTCSDDSQCEAGEECCGGGTYWAGICRPTGTCGEGNLSASGYGWTFTVGSGGGGLGDPCDGDGDPDNGICLPDNTMCSGSLVCNPINCTCESSDIDSCSGYNMLQCANDLFCPNSPGLCSPYPGGGTQVVGNCQFDCEGVGVCTATTCSYDSSLDRCVDGNSCDLTKTVTDIFGNNVTAYCKYVLGKNSWVFSSNASCPNGWIKLNDNRCVEGLVFCEGCKDGFVCQKDDDGNDKGHCVIDQDICPGDAVCQASGKCVTSSKETCECCCEIGQDPRDCCVPLRCEGNCGSDRITDTNTYGYCSGCRIDWDADGKIIGSEQTLSDFACNCEGHSGKYCDVDADVDGDGTPDGVCRDCAQLDSSQCSTHSSTCCIDNMNGDVCRGGDGTLLDGYCAYYSCDTNPPFACSGPSQTGDYENNTCDNQCGLGSGLGLSCSQGATTTCNTDICGAPFACINEDGSASSFPDSCGVCCCDPADPASCSTLNPGNPNLTCQPDQSPCSGNNRGLCCGCENDSDCGLSSGIGCGIDTCCHARPLVTDISPADNSVNICRNTIIRATFDQKIDTSSFTGNIIVFGDYGGDVCPEGTQFLASAQEKKIWKRFVKKALYILSKVFSPILPDKEARAYTSPSAVHNYCAISGTVKAYNNTSGEGVVEFSPRNLLDGNRLYYIVIKGDSNLDDNVKEGVLNYYGVGLNGGSTETFNNITYTNAYIWSFTTLPAQAPNNGVCEIDHIDIEPSSYLFNTIENSSKENDTDPFDDTFDSINDSDKVFVALPKTIDNQILSPVLGYNWTWSWNSSNPGVADIVVGVLDGNDSNQRLIRASNNITEGKTIITATANISTGDNLNGTAKAYVLVCENPWPPINADGTWEPWRDATEGGSCLPNTGTCNEVNYEIYYCRDAGNNGTVDDLPAILSNDTVIRGSSGGIFKEFYFFREDVPEAAESLTVVDNLTGGSVTLNWIAVNGANGYKLYWGTRSGDYSDYLDVGNVISWTVNDLENNQIYYFAFTSYTNEGAESEYSNEVAVTPTDQTAPNAPTALIATPGDGQVELVWDGVADASSYKVYYGANSDVYGVSEDIGNETAVIISGLTNSQTYYFVVTALDESGNESVYSSEVSATPDTVAVGFDSGGEPVLIWNTAGAVGEYVLYYEVIE